MNVFDSRTLLPSKEEVVGTFSIDLASCSVNTSLNFLDKLMTLAQWMKYGPERQFAREHSSKVSSLAEKIQRKIARVAGEVDLNIAADLSRVEKNACDRAKKEVIASMKVMMESNLQEEYQRPAFEILKKRLKSDVIEDTMKNASKNQENFRLSFGMRGFEENRGSFSGAQNPRNSFSQMPKNTTSKELELDLNLKTGVNAQAELMKINAALLDKASLNKLEFVVKMPKYKTNDQGEKDYFEEEDIPSKDVYIALGYDSVAHGEHKHYRKYLSTTLEDSDAFMTGYTFKQLDIHTGKKVATENRNWLQKMLFKDNSYKVVGKFNGSFEIVDEELLQAIANLNIEPRYLEMFGLPSKPEQWKNSILDAKALQPHKVIVRLYVVDAKISEDTDFNSDPDPYLKIKLGSQIVDVSLIYQGR